MDSLAWQPWFCSAGEEVTTSTWFLGWSFIKGSWYEISYEVYKDMKFTKSCSEGWKKISGKKSLLNHPSCSSSSPPPPPCLPNDHIGQLRAGLNWTDNEGPLLDWKQRWISHSNMGGTKLKFEYWKVGNHMPKVSQNHFLLLSQISESWNQVVAWKVPPLYQVTRTKRI